MPTLRPSKLDDELVAFYSSTTKIREFVRKTRAQFNAKQVQVYTKLEVVVVQGRGEIGVGVAQLHFVNRKVGQGKTFLMHYLVTQFRAKGNAILVVGTIGLSIVHYNYSHTTYSAFGIPIKEV